MNSDASKTSDNYGINLNKIQSNFKKYHNESQGNNNSHSFNPNRFSVANESSTNDSSDTYKPTNTMPQTKQTASNTSNATQAEQFKTNYSDNLKKYMNYSGDRVTNTDSSIDNNIEQNAGNKGDWTTTIGNNNDIKYSNIGNDYSVNIGGIGDGFSNMQGAAAYTALNNNQYERSTSQMNGLKRSAQASENANALVGARDRSANLYNSMGYSQNYWRQKADAQQNFYLGDVFKMKAPEWETPAPPTQIEDSTKEIYEEGMDNLKDDD